MAEGWLRALHGERFEAASAGTRPSGLNRLAAAAMAEAGVDISGRQSKHVDSLAGERFDLVVTVCDSAAEACPTFAGAGRTVHRAFDDPPALARGAASDEEAMAGYRRVRDEIRAFVESLPAMLGGAR